MMGDLKELLRTTDRVEAEIVKSVLMAAGVETILLDDHLSRLYTPMTTGGIRLMVREAEFTIAQRILEEARSENKGEDEA